MHQGYLFSSQLLTSVVEIVGTPGAPRPPGAAAPASPQQQRRRPRGPAASPPRAAATAAQHAIWCDKATRHVVPTLQHWAQLLSVSKVT